MKKENKYLEYKAQLEESLQKANSDIEVAHMDADNILCKIAFQAAMKRLSLDEVEELVNLYESIPKQYA